ncbi:MAG: ankyrin repeat domain-containing protein, partial [Phycisphaerales bacterium]|nr:ankyrin repeat domain-containing protein [Phycisphaerales bacterium]
CALARCLLEAGADPNDGQALYNTMFTPGDRCLELLLEFGLGPDAMCNWLIGPPDDLRPNTQRTLEYQLLWAASKHHTARARLLLQHGADASAVMNGKSVWKLARLSGHTAILADLTRHGAREEPLRDTEAFAAACMAGDQAEAARLHHRDPALIERAQVEMPSLLADAAGLDRRDAVRCLVAMGWDINAMTGGNSALHQAAWNGFREMALLLIELGADALRCDRAHDATPADWAAYNGHADVARAIRAHSDDDDAQGSNASN